MVFGLLSPSPGISVPKAYVYGLAGELLALSLGAGLTLLVHGSVPWPEIALLALPLGIIIPCLKRGTPWNRIPLVFFFSLFVALALSYAWDSLLIFVLFKFEYAESLGQFYRLARSLLGLLVLPLLGALYSRTHLGVPRLVLYSLFFLAMFALTLKPRRMGRILMFMDPWALKQEFDIFSVVLRSFYPLLTIGLAEGVLYLRRQWRKPREAQPQDAARASNQALPGSEAPAPAARKDFPDCRDIEMFSAFFPERVGVGEIGKIVVNAHLADVGQLVTEDALRRYNLGSAGRLLAAGAAPAQPLPRGSVITLTPHVPGLRFEVSEVRLALWEDLQAAEFRFRPEPAAASLICRGWITVWLDCARIADLRVEILVAVDTTPEIYRKYLSSANSRPYRRVFPSYSHKDQEIVARFQAYAHSFGDQYLRDVMEIRAGEPWEARILEFIRQADVFQLFWSERAAQSDYVTREWQQALQERQRRPDPYFVRPCFWSEEPASPIPPELQKIHFVRIPPSVQ